MQVTPRQDKLRRVISGLVVLTVLCGLPFVAARDIDWERDNWLLLTGTICFAAGLFVHGIATTTARDAVLLCVTAVIVGLVAEWCGLHFQFPFFIEYEYHSALRPQLWGVPLFIPLSWYALAYAPPVFLRRFRVARGGRFAQVATKSLLCAVALTGADLLLDPLAVSVDAWQWRPPGAYFGVPWLNYAGWLLVGALIYSIYFSLESGRVAAAAGRFDDSLMILFVALTLMALLSVVFRLRHWLPIVLYLPVAAPYWLFWLRHRRSAD